MASTGKSSTLFVQVLFVLALTLLLATCMADSDFHRTGLGEMKDPMQSPVNCKSVHAVEDGETCFIIAQEFGLTTTDLSAFNPNLVCDKLFVGQWLCISAGAAK